MLADGRTDDMKSLFGFYHSIFDVSKARTRAWFNMSGTFFPETKQQSGLCEIVICFRAVRLADMKNTTPLQTTAVGWAGAALGLAGLGRLLCVFWFGLSLVP